KEGKIYLINRNNLGQNVPPPGPDRVVQVLNQGITGVWGNPAFFNQDIGGTNRGIMYYQGSGDVLKGFTLNNGVLHAPPMRSNDSFGFPGAQPSISSNGANNGVVWTLRVDGFGTSQPAVLFAHNATTLGAPIYRSNQTDQRDRAGGSVKFTAPTVSNGHVMFGTQNSIEVFGLFPPASLPPPVPVDLAAAAVSDVQINLSWTNPAPGPNNAPTGIKIERSTDGTNFTQVAHIARDRTTFSDTGLQP